MSRQNVVVIGTGNIGGELIKQIAENDAPSLGRHANPTNVIGMADKDGWLYTPGGVAIQNNSELVARLQATDRELTAQGKPRTAMKNWMQSNYEYKEGGNLPELLKEIKRQGLVDDTVFIDLTAGDLTGFHKKVVENGGKIVTANKIPVAQSSLEVFKLLTQFRKRYGFSCSVMAGAGAVPFLQDTFDTNDTATSIEGCFSGTLGKLCNLLHEGKITFSQAIRQLKLDGDTEPDPRDDLSGMDVAKKIVILARTAGYPINLEDVETEPFVQGGFREITDCGIEEFMTKADIFDKEIAQKFESAKKQGKILRYVASLKNENGKPEVKLGLREEPLDSPLGTLKGNGNKVVIYTKSYEKVPYELSAPGSGIMITAGNIRRDLLKLLDDRKM